MELKHVHTAQQEHSDKRTTRLLRLLQISPHALTSAGAATHYTLAEIRIHPDQNPPRAASIAIGVTESGMVLWCAKNVTDPVPVPAGRANGWFDFGSQVLVCTIRRGLVIGTLGRLPLMVSEVI